MQLLCAPGAAGRRSCGSLLLFSACARGGVGFATLQSGAAERSDATLGLTFARRPQVIKCALLGGVPQRSRKKAHARTPKLRRPTPQLSRRRLLISLCEEPPRCFDAGA